MKPASEWALEFLNKHVLNTRASGEFERLIVEVQKDAQEIKEIEEDLKKFYFVFANFLFEKLTKLRAKK